MNATKITYGHNGYPEMTPGKRWLGTSVYRDGETIYTDIFPSFDDPCHVFRTIKNSPWLAQSDCDAINAYYRKENVHRRSVSREFEPSYWLPIWEAEDRARYMEPVLKRRWSNPVAPFETSRGGWLPNGTTLPLGSQTAQEVHLRQLARAQRDYQTADLIRKTIIGGSVELRDFPDGTLWVFPEQECHHAL